jgi:large subunit ribosomal protein L25
METTNLRVRTREDTGSRAARRILRSGEIPAVLYGPDNEPHAIQINARELQGLLNQGLHENTLITLLLDDEEKSDRLALIKEVQRDPLRGEFRHVDFVHIRLGHEVTVEVPLRLIGDSEGVKMGGVVEQGLHHLEVKCLPSQIPEFIELDISELEIGASLHVSDMNLRGHNVLTDAERTVVSIAAPRVMEEPVVAEVEEVMAEPELIGEEGPEEEAPAEEE